ncbi:COPII subunit, partial [Linderina macrospora]
MPPPPQAGRALSPGGIPTPPSQGPASSYGGSPRPPAPPSQYQNQQYQQQPPMPQQQQQFQQQYPPQQQYQQQQQQQAAPVPPLSPTVSAAAAPSSRRRMYPEQMATAYSAQQQQPAQQPQGFQPPYGGGNLPPLPGSAQQQVPQQSGMSQQSDPAIGAGGFFVPGAAQAPAVPSSTGMPPVSAAAAGYPMQSQQQQMPPQQFQPQMQQMQQPMAGVTQQFAQMGLGPSPQEYQVAMLGGQPQLAALDEPAPIIKLPPSAACVPSPHIVCPAKHKRSTLNAVPKTDKLLKKSKLPFGLVITPFKSQEEGEEPMPVVNEIVRCRRCRTYINPFVQFVEGGRRWKCNMCGLNNDVPLFFDYDSATQTQKDRWQRADLNHAVVEFVAPVEYMVRPPMPPVYVFIIDVSYASVQIGAPGVIGQAILDSLDNIPNVDKRTKVAFLAVDTSLHYFQVRPGSTEPQQLVVGDLDDVFLPSPSDLLLNLDECRQGIENLLSRLGSMFKDNHT